MILSFRTLGAEHTLHGSAQGCRVLQLVITITVILGSCARGVNKVQQCRGGFFSPLFIRMSDLRFIGSVSETRVWVFVCSIRGPRAAFSFERAPAGRFIRSNFESISFLLFSFFCFVNTDYCDHTWYIVRPCILSLCELVRC